MRQKHEAKPGSAEKTVRDIRRVTRRRHSSEEKIRIVLEGLRGEESIAELCRREGAEPERLLSLVEGLPRGREKRSAHHPSFVRDARPKPE
jgi:transposase-like protein